MKTRKLTKGRRRNWLEKSIREHGSRRRQSNFEQLEPRHLLSAGGFGTETEFHPFELPDFMTTSDRMELSASFSPDLAAAQDRALDQSFNFWSDLDRYTQEQLETADTWVVRTHDTLTPADMTSRLSAPQAEAFLPIDNTYLVSVGDQSLNDLLLTFGNDASVRNFYPSLPIEASTLSLPNDPYLEYQWHLISTGQETGNPDHLPVFAEWGEDIRVFPVWEDGGYTGEGVTIGVTDSGIQWGHPDLVGNYNSLIDFDYVGFDSDPSPGSAIDNHATSVAGVAAGVGNNNTGITGVAFESDIVGIRALSDFGNAQDSSFYDILTHEWDEIDVSNNSWGRPTSFGSIAATPFELQGISDAHFFGRGGLGTVFVWAAGNDGGAGGSADFEALASNRRTIAVAALTEEGIPTNYSNGGASLITSAYSGSADGFSAIPVYGGGIWTTDLIGDFGYNLDDLDEDPFGIDPFARDYFPDTDYTSRFSGTSSAAPVVSGVVALMLEANPNLSDRDIQHILVHSGRHSSFNEYVGQPDNILGQLSPFFFTNSAGHTYSYGLGHGVIDAELAVKLAENWQPVGPEITRFSPNTIHGNSVWIFPGDSGDIPQCSDAVCPVHLFSDLDDFPGVPFATFEIPDDLIIEWMEVSITFTMEAASSDEFEILVQSPDGTVDLLTEGAEFVPPGDFLDWTFTTNNFWGERSGGVWLIDFQNFSDNADADLLTLRIDWFGTEAEGSARVQGVISEDLNGNGLIDTAVNPFGDNIPIEPKADGMIVFVDLNENGFREAFEPYTMTGNDGTYYFDLDPHPTGGDYHIRLETPPNMTITNGSELNLVSLSDGNRITLAPILVDPDPITISGNVFIDNDGNGFNNGEPPATNFTVFADLNRDGRPSAGDAFTTTDALGNYSLTVDEGREFYAIFVIPQNNLVVTTPSVGYYYLFLDAGEDVPNLTFAVGTETGPPIDPPITGATITGYLFNDFDADGIRDPGEPGLFDWLVFLDSNDDGMLGLGEPALRTLVNGSYAFTNLDPDFYRTRAIGQPGWDQTGPGGDGSYLLQMFPTQVASNINFGFSNLAPFDYGDLPLGYAVMAAEDGPFHPVQPGFYIGYTETDGEANGAPSLDARGDDLLGHADEDGIAFLDPIEIGRTVRVEVRANSPGGYLQGWADFNHNFVFDVGERIFEDVLLDPGVNLLSFAIPATVTPGDLAMRFRYGEFGIDLPTGAALGGEVEDYVRTASMPITLTFPDGDFDQNGAVDGDDFLVWQANFGMTSGATAQHGDADGDGDVDGDDFLIWQSGFGTGSGSAAVADGSDEGGQAAAEVLDVVVGNADFNSDTLVDNVDFAIWDRGFGKPSDVSRGDGDADGDGNVDGDDFIVWQRQFARPLSGTGSEAAAESTVAETTVVEHDAVEPAASDAVKIDHTDEIAAPATPPRIESKPIRVAESESAVVVKSDPAPPVDPAPILVTGDPVVATQIEPIRVETRQPAAGGIPIQASAKRLSIRGEDAIRFDLAFDELDAISPAMTGARTKLVARPPVVESVALSLPQGAELVAFEASVTKPYKLRDVLEKENRDELFELLAKDRIDRVSTVPNSSRSKGRFDG